jgi:hypothetical protein
MSDHGPKYPDIEVQLTGQDGNAFMILGAVQRALREAVGPAEASAFMDDATAGDYNDLLTTAMRWVTVL